MKLSLRRLNLPTALIQLSLFLRFHYNTLMKNKYLLFDFDGVIADTFIPAFEINKVICPHITEDEYRKRFEGNINDWKDLASKHDENCRHDIDFFAEYKNKIKDGIKIFPGMKNVVEILVKEYTLILISSTITVLIQEILEINNLSQFFKEVMGNDVHKSKIEKIKMVFSKYNINSDNCLFITDTLGDIRESTKVEVGSIGVSWGFNETKTLIEGKPFRIVNTPEELLIAISEYFTN